MPHVNINTTCCMQTMSRELNFEKVIIEAALHRCHPLKPLVQLSHDAAIKRDLHRPCVLGLDRIPQHGESPSFSHYIGTGATSSQNATSRTTPYADTIAGD